MRCPKCGKFSRSRIREIDGRLVRFSECADCGEILLTDSDSDKFSEAIEEDVDYRKKLRAVRRIDVDYVKIFLGILSIGLIGSTSYIYFQLNLRDQEVGGLSRSLLNLKASYSELEENYIVLVERYADLEEYYEELQGMYSILIDEYSVLESTLSNVTSERVRLQQDYFELLSELNSLEQELNEIRTFSKVFVLDNQTVEIPLESNRTFIYNIDYGGYFQISFNSSEDILFWIGSSVTDGVFYSRYPNYPETVYNGTFVVPVSPMAYVYIGNPNDEYNATVSFSVKYIY